MASELKADKTFVFGEECEAYKKAEADKFIADLEESHKREVEQLLMEIVKLKGDYKEACDRLHTAGLVKDEPQAKAKADIIEEAGKKYQGLVPLVYDIETMGLDEARPQDMPYAVYLKREADKVLADKDAEIAGLKAMVKEPSVPNRTCRKCGNTGTLMYMPIAKDGRTYWNLYNNKGIDYVLGIQCAHCGEVAFVTKQVHEYELRKQKLTRCLDKAKWCDERIARYTLQQDIQGISWQKEIKFYRRLKDKYIEISKRFDDRKVEASDD